MSLPLSRFERSRRHNLTILRCGVCLLEVPLVSSFEQTRKLPERFGNPTYQFLLAWVPTGTPLRCHCTPRTHNPAFLRSDMPAMALGSVAFYAQLVHKARPSWRTISPGISALCVCRSCQKHFGFRFAPASDEHSQGRLEVLRSSRLSHAAVQRVKLQTSG